MRVLEIGVEQLQVTHRLLVLFEKNVVLDFVILRFGEFEAHHAEVVFETSDFGLISVDFAHIELDIVSCG